jgi:hypothetical protein
MWDAELAVLTIEIDPRQIDGPELQRQSFLKIVTSALLLKRFALGDSNAFRGSFNPDQLTPPISNPNETDLEIFRPGFSEREKYLLKPFLPLGERRVAHRIEAAALDGAADALNGRCAYEK